MKTLNPLKVPFGTAKGVALRGVRYLQWEDAFEVDFEDGLTFLEPHATIRKANKISPRATVRRVELEDELKHGFFIHYDNGQTAEVSWSFIRELPPKNSKKQCCLRRAKVAAATEGGWLGFETRITRMVTNLLTMESIGLGDRRPERARMRSSFE